MGTEAICTREKDEDFKEFDDDEQNLISTIRKTVMIKTLTSVITGAIGDLFIWYYL